MTFVNAVKELKQVPIVALDMMDQSLFKRLKHAKEILQSITTQVGLLDQLPSEF